nr:TPA: RAP domain-containing protein [Toxoplasma gondii VEG]
MASLSKAEQHRKRMRKIMDKRMAWRPPNVSAKYLRAEADFNVLSVQRPRARRARDTADDRRKEILDFAHSDSVEKLDDARRDRRLLKPHEVAKLVGSSEKVVGTRDDKATAASLRRGHLPASSSIRELTAQDVDFQRRPEAKEFGFNAAERMFGAKGLYQENDADYYKRFFKDRYRRLDGKEREAAERLKAESANSLAKRRPRQPYIPPKKYWYKDNYSSPLPSDVRTLPSLTLKFAMMNEARLVKTGQAPLNLALWRAFEARLLQLAGPRTNVRAATLLRALHAMSKIQHPVLPATLEGLIRGLTFREASLKPQHYVFLYQAFARLRYRHVYLVRGLKEMMLSWSTLRNNFLIKAANAICKLDLAHHILIEPLRATLAARIPGFSPSNCRRVKWITVLGLFSDAMILSFLRVCHKHEHSFRTYSRNLQLIELYLRLEKPEVYAQLPLTTQFFLECLRRTHTEDAEEDESEDESDDEDDADDESPTLVGDGQELTLSSSLSVADFIPSSPSSSSPSASPYSSLSGSSSPVHSSSRLSPTQWTSETDNEAEDPRRGVDAGEACAAAVEASAALQLSQTSSAACAVDAQSSSVAKQTMAPVAGTNASPSATTAPNCTYSSALHEDVSRMLRKIGVGHSNSVMAGPLTVDMFHAASQTVIEVCPSFQFYANSVQFTALSKRRHQLLLSMGFKLVLIPHQRWGSLQTEEEKKKLLFSLLPPSVLHSALNASDV